MRFPSLPKAISYKSRLHGSRSRKPGLETLEGRVLLTSIIDLGIEYDQGIARFAEAIDDSGQVVGWSRPPGGSYHAFLYTEGTMIDLGTLGGSYSAALGINNLGQVVGYSATSAGPNYFEHAFLYSNGAMTDLGTLGGHWSFAYGINASGQVVGDAYLPPNADPDATESTAFLYSDGAMIGLGTLGGYYSRATDINDSGAVVGWSYTINYANEHAFLYSDGAMNDLGTLGGYSSSAAGINGSGQVVGQARTVYGSDHAFLYSGGVMADLGTLGGSSSAADDINDSGQVVGQATTSAGQSHAFLYIGNMMYDLNDFLPPDSAWTLIGATGINNNGQIIGFGQYHDEYHVFLLNVRPDPITVTNANDDGPGSLRQAILIANAFAGPDRITFDIPGTGVQTIHVNGSLPAITDTVTIDATSQPGYADVRRPRIELDGRSASGDGLTIQASDCVIRGLAVDGFPGSGIRLTSGGRNILQGNFLGVDPNGFDARGNGGEGLFVDDSYDNTIGGTVSPADPSPPVSGPLPVVQCGPNVISGNGRRGVLIVGAGSTGNLLIGNRIGTDELGLTDLGNGWNGIDIWNAPNNTVGGTTSDDRNIISGNDQRGIVVLGTSATQNVVLGNYIGTDRDGLNALGNTWNGVEIWDAPANTIGGTADGAFPAHWDPKLRIPRGQVVAAASIVSPKY